MSMAKLAAPIILLLDRQALAFFAPTIPHSQFTFSNS